MIGGNAYVTGRPEGAHAQPGRRRVCQRQLLPVEIVALLVWTGRSSALTSASTRSGFGRAVPPTRACGWTWCCCPARSGRCATRRCALRPSRRRVLRLGPVTLTVARPPVARRPAKRPPEGGPTGARSPAPHRSCAPSRTLPWRQRLRCRMSWTGWSSKNCFAGVSLESVGEAEKYYQLPLRGVSHAQARPRSARSESHPLPAGGQARPAATSGRRNVDGVMVG